MKLLVGLGNPGDKYAGTRHNAGFQVAERVAARHQIALKKKGYQGLYGVGRPAGEETTILLPQTFMEVGSDEQLEFLRSRGCDEVQGYLYSRPLTVAGIESWLQAFNSELCVVTGLSALKAQR